MSNYYGNRIEDSTVVMEWGSYDGGTGASITQTDLVVGDVVIFKDGGVAQKTTTNGITVSNDFDGRTGLHLISIDTSNDVGDAGFWVAQADYQVAIDAVTIDGQTVRFWAGHFSIENEAADVRRWRGTVPNVLVANRVDASVGAMAANVLTAAAIAANAITSSKIATNAIGAAQFAQGAADKVWSSATRTLTAFSTSLALSVWDVLETAILTASSIGLKVKDNLNATITSRSSHSAADAADAVWDETIADHLAAGSTGEALNNTPTVAQIWAETFSELTAIPGTSPQVIQMLQFIYQYFKLRRDASGSSEREIMFREDETELGAAGMSSDGTDFRRDEFA